MPRNSCYTCGPADLKLKDVAKAMGKVFACGASVSDTASGGKEIVIQGDVLDPLAAMLEDKYQVRASGVLGKEGELLRLLWTRSPPLTFIRHHTHLTHTTTHHRCRLRTSCSGRDLAVQSGDRGAASAGGEGKTVR